jgi:hypothetical protein
VPANDLNREECSAKFEAEFIVPLKVLRNESRSATLEVAPRTPVIDLKREDFSVKLEVGLNEPLRDRTTARRSAKDEVEPSVLL